MKPEEQRIAIAEACGWTDLGLYSNARRLFGYRPKPNNGNGNITEVPDYLNDLNAMHEAEKVVIAQGLQDHWLDTLVEVVVGKDVHWSDYHCFPQVNRATAAQRAEAFLKTLGLWTEE